MTSSLRDALRQSGVLDQFKPIERTPRKPGPGKPGGGSGRRRDGGKPAANSGSKPHSQQSPRPPRAPRPDQRSQEEIDLARAYALRARAEQREREEKLRIERETAERRRVQRAQVQALLDGHVRNREDAEIPRHFEYGGKIRRVYVDEAQLAQVNDGRLGVIQMRGRYLLVERELAERIAVVDANAVALLVDPDTVPAEDDLIPAQA